MARYIDADFVTENINLVLEEKKSEKETTAYFAFEQFKFLLGQAPTADVAEVKHGKFIKRTPCSEPECDQCGKCPKLVFGMLPNYCPHCGAKMDVKAWKERENE